MAKEEFGETEPPALIWRPRRIGFARVAFQRRAVGMKEFSDGSEAFADTLIFEGSCLSSGFGSGLPLCIRGSEHRIADLTVRLELQRRTKERARDWTSSFVGLQETNAARSSSHSQAFAQRWDSSIWFDGVGTSRVSALVGSYAEPVLFDRFLTLNLSHCIAHIWLNIAVQIDPSEVNARISDTAGLLPELRNDMDGDAEHQTSTYAELLDLAVVQLNVLPQ